MIKSVSLKEFSTTPTVSYMLSKNGQNIATHVEQQQLPSSSVSSISEQNKNVKIAPIVTRDDDLYEMDD